jgi:hypothetical protein
MLSIHTKGGISARSVQRDTKKVCDHVRKTVRDSNVLVRHEVVFKWVASDVGPILVTYKQAQTYVSLSIVPHPEDQLLLQQPKLV